MLVKSWIRNHQKLGLLMFIVNLLNNMNTIKDTLDLYKNASRILATIFFRYIYEDESIEPSDISFVADGCDTAECWYIYFGTNDMYDILYHWYAPKLVKDWYDYAMASDEVVTIRFFKHLVDTHGYTTPEQLLEDHKKGTRTYQ